MMLYCPRCRASAAGTGRCPGCGGRLATPSEAHASRPDLHAAPPDLVRPTAAGRLAMGALVGLGLFVGLREWAAAGLLAADERWTSPVGVATAATVKLLAAAVAGLLAGTSRPKGAHAGLTAGFIAAGLLLVAVSAVGDKPTLYTIATGAGLIAAAAAGGAVGAWRWPAATDLPPAPTPGGSSLAALIPSGPTGRGERPLLWGRVFAGGMIAAAGIALADPARDLVKRGSAGSVGFGGTSMVTVVDLEIAALFVMLGGVLAGAGTGVGMRHGLLAGIVGGLATVWMPAAGVRSVFPVVEGLLKVLGLPTGDYAGWGAAFNLLLAVLAVAAFGGWLGGTLFPPVVAREKLKRRLMD
jgi:hypothetical protein